jgi:hypothetical protein
VSSPWVAPDLRPAAEGTALSAAPARTSPAWWQDAWAGLLTVAVTVLVGAPVGLLWAALAPRVVVRIEGADVRLADTWSDGFIAVDGYYLAAVLLAGAVGGALSWWWADDHGPAVVVGLVVGGRLAAAVAMVVGSLVGDGSAADLVAAGAQGRQELGVRLRARTAVLGWPVASLVLYLLLSLRPERPVSSG